MQSNWQTVFFRSVALDFWRRVTNPEQTRREVEFLEKALRAGPNAQLLDVPCGNGRHAIELARRGYRMTGVDLSEEFIVEARGATPLPVRWILGDMRELPWSSEFDGAYCFGNSFGYLDRDGTREFLSAVARALKPGGRFVVETGMAAESILHTMAKNRWLKAGDTYMLSESQYHPADGRLDTQYTFIRNGEVETKPSASYIFTVAEICRMHAEAGLEPEELLGSAGGEPYQVGSRVLILVSSRK